jgi:hypothetical protein
MYILENTSFRSPLESLSLNHVGLGIISTRYTLQGSKGERERERKMGAPPAEYKANSMDVVRAALNIQDVATRDERLDRLEAALHHELKGCAKRSSIGQVG